MKLRFHFLEKEVENRNKFEIWAEIWIWKFQSLESWEMTFINSFGFSNFEEYRYQKFWIRANLKGERWKTTEKMDVWNLKPKLLRWTTHQNSKKWYRTCTKLSFLRAIGGSIYMIRQSISNQYFQSISNQYPDQYFNHYFHGKYWSKYWSSN